jgi:hypothetical protein
LYKTSNKISILLTYSVLVLVTQKIHAESDFAKWPNLGLTWAAIESEPWLDEQNENFGRAWLDPSTLSEDTGDYPELIPDSRGLRRDTAYFMLTPIIVIGVIYASPEGISGWSPEEKEEYSFSKWSDNVQNVVWDPDKWWINYLLHPYWGGTYFVRASERSYGPAASFWYSALLSMIYEFGLEAFFEQPSQQDLIITPVLGFFVGKVFMSVRNKISLRVHAGQPLTLLDRTTLGLTDPLGVLNRGIDRLIGYDAEVSLSPSLMYGGDSFTSERGTRFYTGQANDGNNTVYIGLKLNIRW